MDKDGEGKRQQKEIEEKILESIIGCMRNGLILPEAQKYLSEKEGFPRAKVQEVWTKLENKNAHFFLRYYLFLYVNAKEKLRNMDEIAKCQIKFTLSLSNSSTVEEPLLNPVLVPRDLLPKWQFLRSFSNVREAPSNVHEGAADVGTQPNVDQPLDLDLTLGMPSEASASLKRKADTLEESGGQGKGPA